MALAQTAAIYMRVSTEMQDGPDKHSLDEQEEMCKLYAVQQGWEVLDAHIYRDVHTGTELMQRPEVMKLIKAMQNRAFDNVVIYAVDRAARDVTYTERIVFEAKEAQIGFHSVTEGDLIANPLVRFIRSYMAEEERKKIVDRTMMGRTARLKSGKVSGNGPAPYGYQYVGDKNDMIEPVPEKVPHVEYIFESAAQGVSLTGIAQGLNRLGLPTPQGGSKKWSPTTVKYIVENPAYKGEWQGKRWEYVKDPLTKRKTRKERDPENRIPVRVPPIIDETTWFLAQAGLKKQTPFPRQAKKDWGHLLNETQQIVCGLCGCTLSRSHSKRKRVNAKGEEVIYEYPAYCHHTVRSGEKCVKIARSSGPFDDMIWSAIVESLKRKELFEAYFDSKKQEDTFSFEIERLEKHRDQLKKEHKRMLERYMNAEDDTDADDLAYMRELANAKKEAMKKTSEELEALKMRQALATQHQSDMDRVKRLVEALPMFLEGGEDGPTLEQKRLIAKAFQIRVKVWPTNMSPNWVLEGKLNPNALEHMVWATSEDGEKDAGSSGNLVSGVGESTSHGSFVTTLDKYRAVSGTGESTTGRSVTSSLDIVFTVSSANPTEVDIRLAA